MAKVMTLATMTKNSKATKGSSMSLEQARMADAGQGCSWL